MKCDNLIADVEKKKRGKVKLVKKFFKPMHMLADSVCEWSELPDGFRQHYEKQNSLNSPIPPEGAIPCGGNIKVTIEAVDEPEWGGTSASLEISYKCDKCGCTWYPELPSKYDISEFTTKMFEEIPQNKLVELRNELKKTADARTRTMKEFRREAESRSKGRK